MFEPKMMAICPRCRAKFRYWLRHRGKAIPCPKCGLPIRLPINARPKEEGKP